MFLPGDMIRRASMTTLWTSTDVGMRFVKMTKRNHRVSMIIQVMAMNRFEHCRELLIITEDGQTDIVLESSWEKVL